MIFSMVLLYGAVFPRIASFEVKITVLALFTLSMLLSIICWLMDPGYIRKDPDFDFMELLELFEPNCLCPECEVIRTPRSRHCNIC